MGVICLWIFHGRQIRYSTFHNKEQLHGRAPLYAIIIYRKQTLFSCSYEAGSRVTHR